jgi:hypothetical protein
VGQNAEATLDILRKSHHALKCYRTDPIVNIDYLEGVAGMRCALAEVASLLHSSCGVAHQQLRLNSLLIQTAQEVCTDPHTNTTNFLVGDLVGPVGPAVYLLRLVIRQYGFNSLRSIAAAFPWVMPEGLHATNQVR